MKITKRMSKAKKLELLAQAVEAKGEEFDWSKPTDCVGGLAAILVGAAPEDGETLLHSTFGLSKDEAERVYYAMEIKSIQEPEVYWYNGAHKGITGATTAARWLRKLAAKYAAPVVEDETPRIVSEGSLDA